MGRVEVTLQEHQLNHPGDDGFVDYLYQALWRRQKNIERPNNTYEFVRQTLLEMYA
jgi:hypothetical protein